MTQPLLIDGIDVIVEGNGARTLLMIHGWPDTHRLWDAQAAFFRDRYRCVRFTLPGFDVGKPPRPTSLADTVALIGKIIDRASPNGKATLMLHDWGCAFGYAFATQHPARVEAVVAVDVGDAGSAQHIRELGAKAKAMVFAYQSWLAAAWKIGGRAGETMTRKMARIAGAPADPQLIGAQMNYPYYIQWTGAYGGYRQPKRFEPSCPMLYLHGTRKPFQFQSQAWTEALAARPGCQVTPMATGHWIMREQPEQFNAVVDAWLEANILK
jgi:pimeloyl-ACP methyl ester carboxylesterase